MEEKQSMVFKNQYEIEVLSRFTNKLILQYLIKLGYNINKNYLERRYATYAKIRSR